LGMSNSSVGVAVIACVMQVISWIALVMQVMYA